MAAENWTLTQVLNQLNSGSTWSGSQITYSFPTVASGMSGSGERAGFEQFTNVQITFAEYALACFDDLMSPDFVESTGTTNIEFGNTTTDIEYAHAYYPTNGSVWMNPTYDDIYNPVIGDYGYGTFVHELGHALGLSHMGDYNGSDNNGPSSYQDSTVLSIMSYYGPDQGSDGENQVMWADWIKDGTTYAAQTPMLNDIMAIQAMYGVETTTRTGDTVYGFNSNINGNAAHFFDFTINANPILSIFDSAGIDTLDLSGFSTQCSISLVAGSFSDCNEMTYNISIAYTATIENAVGGSSSDTIVGNDVANILTGGRGNDTIDGAGGTDIATFSGAFANYTIVSHGSGSYTVTDNVGTDGTDTLTSIETLRFSDRDSTGSTTAPAVSVALVDQSTDPDALFSFIVPVGTFTDPNGDALTYTATLENGSALPAWLSFNATTRTFSGTPSSGDIGTLAIKVIASDGTEQASDVFALVIGDPDGEPIIGTSGADRLTGTDAGETIRALAGKDKIHAGAGDDILEGGKGRDILWGEDGADIFKFGNKNGEDDIKDFSFADGDQIDLSGVNAISGFSDLVNNHLSSLQGHAYIKFSNGHDILLLNIDKNDLEASDFIF